MESGCTVGLYLLPVVARLGLGWPPAWDDVVLSLLPLLVVLPSLYLPRCFASPNREHEVRHAVYALAFTVAAGSSVRWDTVVDRFDEAWVAPLIAYLSVGSVTLWWFCLSHVCENSVDSTLYTHQGDVAVLPLTLVAIATFANDVPTEAYRFSRSIIFYVPVIVAWATFHFLAYNRFAVRTVTTYEEEGFFFLAHAGLVIGSAHLFLLEVEAPPFIFQFFPVVAAILCQVTHRVEDRPALRPGRAVGSVTVGTALGVGLGELFRNVFGPSYGVAYSPAVIGVVLPLLTFPRLSSKRWMVPATLYATLLTAAFYDAADVRVRAVDVLGIAAGFYTAQRIAHFFVPGTWTPQPPPDTHSSAPSTLSSFADCKRRFVACTVPLPASRRYDETVFSSFAPAHPNCPRDFAGIWWMKDNPLPHDLVSVQSLEWSEDGKEAVMWMYKHTTFRATLGGFLLRAVSLLSVKRITVLDGGWIRTHGYVLPPLRLFAHTYWLHRKSADEMTRLVCNANGEVAMRYRMVRVVRGDGSRTSHAAAFLASAAGRRYWLDA